ncbi:MAG: hypothetical protein ACE5JN_03530 [Candidatus Methylomirabilia bacterium]
MTEEALMQLGGLVFTVALIPGPLVWAVLLNLRERRQSTLCWSVMRRFVPRDFHGRVAVQVRYPLLSRRGVVRVDVLLRSRDEVWDVITRLSQIPVLSPNVGLELKGPVDRLYLATFTVETTGRQPLRRVSQPSLATG